MFVVERLFKFKSRFLKIIGVILFMGGILLSGYVSLAVAALIGVEKSNEWAVSYVTSFVSEFSVIGPLTSFLKINIFKKSLSNIGCLYRLIKKILQNQMSGIMENLR